MVRHALDPMVGAQNGRYQACGMQIVDPRAQIGQCQRVEFRAIRRVLDERLVALALEAQADQVRTSAAPLDAAAS